LSSCGLFLVVVSYLSVVVSYLFFQAYFKTLRLFSDGCVLFLVILFGMVVACFGFFLLILGGCV